MLNDSIKYVHMGRGIKNFNIKKISVPSYILLKYVLIISS